jgi:RHS repeat-associated protein
VSGDPEAASLWGYAGKRYDPATGSYDYGFRDYAPSQGGFTSVDPIRDGANWYGYCDADPVNFVDLWGLSASDRSVDVADSINIPKAQIPFDETDYHCDINAWNSVLGGGRNPQTPGKKNWDGNELTVGQIVTLYKRDDKPKAGTGGYGFFDSPNDNDDIPEHMYRYEYPGLETIDIWNSNGIDPVSHSVVPLSDSLIVNSVFVSLPSFSPNLAIQ